MTTNELKRFIELCLIQTIVFYRIDRDDPDYPVRWEVWVRGYEGTAVGKIEGPLKNSSRTRENKVYTSLDRAYTAMKNLNFNGRFEIDG